MQESPAKVMGWMAISVGLMGIAAVVSLILFFVGLFQDIPFLSFMGSLNDTINALASILSAVLASALHPTLRKFLPRVSVMLLPAIWIGAFAVTFGSWLILTGRSDVELSSYYFFFGNGLIGVWLWVLNHVARAHTLWPRKLTQWGLVASAFMLVGLLGLYGILLGSDGSEYSPLVMAAGISFFGIGIFYPIWSLWLGRWILSKSKDAASTARAQRSIP